MADDFRIRPEGIAEIQAGISAGMVLIGQEIAARGKANIAPYRRTGAVEDSIRVVDVYADDWPHPAVIVTTASGDGFFVHEGTIDTPARPFFTQALDSVISEIPTYLKHGFDVGTRGARTLAFGDLNDHFKTGITSK